MQTVLGFFVGYIVIAQVLLPLYYRFQLTSIYTYLEHRFGIGAYKTGALFFLTSKTIGAAARLYVVAAILQFTVFDTWNIPFWMTVLSILLLVWLYTFKSGIKTIIWTDTLQATIMISALVILAIQLFRLIELPNLISVIWNSSYSQVFVFDDWMSKQHFVKQFFSGIFIAIVMTGLDQDMMQKNLTCRTLKDAQKNMMWYGAAFIPVNLIFLLVGLMLILLSQQLQVPLPQNPDQIITVFASNHLGTVVYVLFVVGIIAAAFSSADSALAALTTSFSVDIMNANKKTEAHALKIRKYTHISLTLLFVVIIILFDLLNNKSVIDAIYVIASYTYGPLLGMFAFGLFTKWSVRDKLIPLIAVLSPLACYGIGLLTNRFFGYALGYELLMLNGFLSFLGLFLIRIKKY